MSAAFSVAMIAIIALACSLNLLTMAVAVHAGSGKAAIYGLMAVTWFVLLLASIILRSLPE